MFKKILNFLLLSSIGSAIFMLFFACSVGLGESVDTEVPKIEITYPPASSPVRDWFYLAGNCSDDKGVDSIVVSAKNISTNENFTLGTAIPAKDGTWQIKINEKDSGGNYKLKDGTYTFSVIATDSSKQQSAPNIRTLELDNTAPVFVIKNPGTTKSDSPAPFGSILKIVGAAADEHEIYELELKVYSSADMSGEPKATLIEKNVDKTDGINVTLARYNPDVALGAAAADELHNNYLSIYNDEGGGDQQLFASVTLRDSAGVWQNPLHTAAESIGNSTSGGLYLNDDIYDELMGKKSKYGLTAADFMKIINGTYKNVTAETSENENSENNRAVETDSKKITEENIQEVLAILNKAKTDTSSTPLSFKLNKDANPTYEVMGFAFNDSEAETFASHKAAKKSSLTFKAQAGLDGTYIKPSTLKVYMFGPYSSCSLEQLNEIRTEPESYYNSAVEKAKEQLKAAGNANPSEELVEATANARILADYSENSSSSTETFTETIELPSTITKGSFYVLAASGKDIDGLSLLTQNNYGFVGESAGTPPTIVIDGFTDGAMANVLGNVKVSGTLKSEETELAGVTYSVVVFDEINAKNIATITGEANFNFKDSKLSADWNIADFSKGNKNYVNGYSSFEPNDCERFKYSVTVSGKDRTGLESKDTKSFTVDMKKPDIKINDITPVAKKETEESGTTYIVNGTVKFSAVVTDTNLQSVKATVSDGTTTKTLFERNNSTIEADIDTTEFADNSTLTFKVVATDNAGNVSEHSRNDVFVKQETDKPVISFTNGKTSAELGDGWTNVTNGQNVFGIENNNSANFTITDDDGIASVKLTIFDESGKIIGSPEEYSPEGSTSYNINYALPKTAGRYRIDIEAIDTEYKNVSSERTDKDVIQANRKTDSRSFIVVSEGNLLIKFKDSKISNDECKIKKEDTSIMGTLSLTDTEKVNLIECYSMKLSEKSWVKDKLVNSYVSNLEEGKKNEISINIPEGDSKVHWSAPLPVAQLKEGENHFFYIAKDKAGNSASIELTCYVDGIGPNLQLDTKELDENWKKSTSVKLSVLVSDFGIYSSGIDKVTYSYTKDAEPTVAELSAGNECDEYGNEKAETKNWRRYSTRIDLGETSKTTIKFYAKDFVGNPSNDLSYDLKVDSLAPQKNKLEIAPNLYKKNTESVSVSYAFSDATSGIAKIEFCTDNKFDTSSKTYKIITSESEGTDFVIGTKDYGTAEESKTILIPLAELKDGEYKIYAKVTDVAGNVSDIFETDNLFTVDNTSPVVKITSHTKESTEKNPLNKVVTFSGIVNELNLPENATPILYAYKEKWQLITSIETKLEAQSWSLTFDTNPKDPDSVLYDLKPGTLIPFQVVFTDKADNSNFMETETTSGCFNINQISDLPIITFSDITDFEGSVISRSSFKGFVSDDDGDVKGLWYIDSSNYDSEKLPSEGNANGWKKIDVATTTGDWKITLEKEGGNSFEFCAIDNAGTVFDTRNNSAYNRPILKVGTKTQPEPQSIKLTYDKTPPAVKVSYAHDAGFENASSLFGPNESVYIKAVVTEAVGLNSEYPIVLEIAGISRTANATVTSIKNEEGNVIGYTYTFDGISIKDIAANGSAQIAVTAKDKAGLEGKGIEQITIDTESPTIKIVSPTATISDAITGAVTIKGIAQDNASLISKVEYLIPTIDQVELLKTTGNISTGWKEVGNSGSWEIQFASGAAESPDSILYYVHGDNQSIYAVEKYGSDTENMWKVPIYFRVTDSCGNIGIRTTYKDSNSDNEKELYVLADPDGGKPRVWVNSPEEESTTSGLVTIYGGASDDVSVKCVQIQIDANGDGNFDSEDFDLINSDTGNWVGTDAKLYIGGNASDWWITANGTNSWKRAINTDNIIASADGKMYLRFRVRSYDFEDKTRGWSNPIKVNIDNNAPVIKDLKVVQFGTEVTADSSNVSNLTPITEREYISGMYVSHKMEKVNGTFYLVGKISDNMQVKDVIFNKLQTSSSLPSIDLGISDISNNKTSEYNLCIPLKTDSSGQIYYSIKAKDDNTGETSQTIIINIDSTKPGMFTTGGSLSEDIGDKLRLKSLGKNLGTNSGNSTVVNSNNFFTFGDIVSESGSGLAYIVATFERNGSSDGKRIYNPMDSNTKLSLASSESESYSDGKPYICEEGFAIQKVDVERPSEDSIKSSTFAETSTAVFIQKGGLIRIAGTYCLITNFDKNNGIITLSKAVSDKFKTAELIFGQVIDHQIVETPKDVGGEENGDVVVENDDGDGMVETITQTGSSYNWTASIVSTKIPDGPITIHVVAIDNAGNTNYGYVKTKVENNRPRIAKVMLATDLNGNGKFDYDASAAPITGLDSETVNSRTADNAEFGEFSFYSAMEAKSTNLKSEVELKSGSFKVIGGLAILPEFVGGNGDIWYVEKYSNDSSSTDYTQISTGTASSDLVKMTSNSTLTGSMADFQYKFADKDTNHSGVTYADLISEKGGIILNSVSKEYISFTFWDSTEETTSGIDSQWTHLKIPVTVLSSETEKPVPTITPFYWESKRENSVEKDSDGNLLGHIELEGDLTSELMSAYGDTDSLKKPKVSGKIKIEGTVTDNVRISSINMGFDGLFSYTLLANYVGGTWQTVSSLPNGVVAFTVHDVSISQKGHEVKYTLVVDTEKLAGVAGKNKNITISATDWTEKNTSVAGTVQTTENAKTAMYTVDVVPYVTGIGTELSAFYRGASSVYARTSTGRYPLHEDESITFYGFNLGTPDVALNGTTLSSGGTEVSLSDIVGGSNKATVTTGTTATSGAFTVSVNDSLNNSLQAINNMNDNLKEYNQQPNNVNNNTLNDDLYADVWQFKNAAEPINGGAKYVTMKINPKTGVPGFSYANSILYFNMPGYNADNGADSWGTDNKTVSGSQYSQIPFGMNYGGFSHNTFTFDNYGYSYGAAMCTDTQSAKASAFFQFFSRETPIPYNTMDQNMNYVNSANASRLDSSTVQISNDDTTGWVTDIDRIQSISMETTHASTDVPSSSTPTYVYMAYYDKSARQVRFRWGTVGDATDNIDGKANSTPNNSFSRVGNSYGLDDIVDSGYTGYAQGGKGNGSLRNKELPDSYIKYSYTKNSGVPIQVVAANGIRGANAAYSSATTYGAGEYVSLAIVDKDSSNPIAVVSWYDSKNMQLCMAYNTSPTTSNNWVSKIVDSNGGINVKIAADSDGGIHFAYYDNKGGSDLKYAYMSSCTAAPQIVSVDSFGSVGAKCTIDLAKNANGKWVPYIGYQMNAYLGTPLAAKIAYLPEGVSVKSTIPAGVNDKDCYTGKWEVSIVPTSNIPNDDLINVGVWRDSNGNAKVFTSNSDWSIGDVAPGQVVSNSTLNVGNATIVHGNNTSNPIIGYGIDTGAIEMAQKK